jgi:hypothetical protein
MATHEKSELAAAIRDALAAFGPDGEIPYPLRRGVRRALEATVGGGKEGHHAWATLEMLSARRVVDIWTTRFPLDRRPIELLTTAERHLLGELRVDDGGRMLGEAKTLLDDKFSLGEPVFKAIYAGFACWAAARSSLFHSEPPAASSEQELDPERWDASFFASLAMAGGAVWEASGDAEKRRRFWEWFLRDGVWAAKR